MPALKPKPKAFIFDIFGTIVDWRSGVATVCEYHFKQKNIELCPHTFADAWRAKYQPAMEKIRSGNRGYFALDILHRENLDQLLAEHELTNSFSETEKQKLNKAWEKLPPWSDSVEGLSDLKKVTIIAPCSNGSISLMTRLAKFGNLPWDCILGAEIANNYKPNAEVYLKSVAAIGLNPDEVVMVAAHNSDLDAARNCGLQTAFIPRPTEHGKGQQIDLEPTSEWDYIVSTIGALAAH
jgi:2-haloacid dehalogenase